MTKFEFNNNKIYNIGSLWSLYYGDYYHLCVCVYVINTENASAE